MHLRTIRMGRSMLNARMNQAIDHGRNWNDGDVSYSELETAISRSIIC